MEMSPEKVRDEICGFLPHGTILRKDQLASHAKDWYVAKCKDTGIEVDVRPNEVGIFIDLLAYTEDKDRGESEAERISKELEKMDIGTRTEFTGEWFTVYLDTDSYEDESDLYQIFPRILFKVLALRKSVGQLEQIM